MARTDKLIEQYGKFSPMNVNAACTLANKVFGDKPANREEAEILLGVSALFSSADIGWQQIVTHEVRRHLLPGPSHGALQEGAENWLIATLATVQAEQKLVLALVQDVIHHADNASEKLGRLGLHAALASMKAVAPGVQNLDVKTA